MSKINELFNENLIIANVGLELFTNVLEELDVKFAQVDWCPPAEGNQELLDILAMLEN